jgi:hypothetical protein
MAVGQKDFLETEGIDTYDAIQVSIEWVYPETARKFNSTILTNWVDPHITSAMSDQKIKYIGTLGRVECDQKERGLRVVSDAQGIEDINPYFSDFRFDVDDRMFEFRGYGYESIWHFLQDCTRIKRGEATWQDFRGLRATFQDARVSTAVIEAVAQSLKENGNWITIDTEALKYES